MATTYDFDRLVQLESGEVDRRVYSETDIFELEMTRIFGRAWLFLCHESQIRETGDFFESVIGRDNVLVVRQKDGSIKGLLNTCLHRGNAICRAEEGNAKGFLCTYHGWSYGIDGKLTGVPGYRDFYGPEFDKTTKRLGEVAQLDSYKGFVFATLDPSAPPLQEYLGATGRLGLDLLAERGDMEVVPGIQKFIVDCNWKFALDNLFDWYHPQVTHISAFQSGALGGPPPPPAGPQPEGSLDMSGVQMESGADLALPVANISGRPFDQIVVLGEFGHGIGGPSAASTGNPEFNKAWREDPRVREALGPVGVRVAGHPSIFPTTWVTTSNQLSLRIPRSPDSTEIWWFTFVDRNASPDSRRKAVSRANRIFGPSGVLEQDDGENWSQSTMQTRGLASNRLPNLLNMGLGRGPIIKEHGLARIESTTNEHAQLWTYHAWAQWMKGLDWPGLRLATTPGDQM
jgi:phenylpropionate dioxygenase-like ring-hydroxylating dioxygenase large terminal subunit